MCATAKSGLVVHPHLHRRYTGVTRHVESVAPGLTTKFDCRVLGSNVVRFQRRLSWSQFLVELLRRPVVWHAHRNGEALLGLLCRLLSRRLRVVFTRHSATPPSWLTRWLSRRVHRFVCLTEEVAAQFETASVRIPHGVDLSLFGPPVDRAEAWRQRGLPGRFGIAVVGRVHPKKRPADFVDALAPLLSAHPDWTPLLIGLIKDADQALAEGFRVQSAGRLVLAGEHSDMRAWYEALSIVVLPSPSEGFSLALLEAMASGCCVVAARLPHFVELVDDGRDGFLYPVGDVAALQKILCRLLQNPAEVAEVGLRAAKTARERFDVAAEVSALTVLYLDLFTHIESQT